MFKFFIRPVLFLISPESAHNFIIDFISKLTFLLPVFKLICNPQSKEKIIVNDLVLNNRIGLAAGFDKNGKALRLWKALGFSFAEIGTVTPLPQQGNPMPRIFRLKKDNALINRLGFNNEGADKVLENILNARKHTGKEFIIGINIGKNKETPIEKAYEDYKVCLTKLYDAADYITINISSPNTKELRTLQKEKHLNKLLYEIQDLNIHLSLQKRTAPKTIFLKIAPELDSEELTSIYDLSVKYDIDGIIATNTTVSREGLTETINEEGGLSGKPLKKKSDFVLSYLNELNKKSSHKLLLIGSGGVFNRIDMENKMQNGASLVQIYTSLVYEGPGILKKLLK